MKWIRHKFEQMRSSKSLPWWEAKTDNRVVLTIEPDSIDDGVVDMWGGNLTVELVDRYYNHNGQVYLNDRNPERLKTKMEKEYKKFVAWNNKRVRQQMKKLKKSLL